MVRALSRGTNARELEALRRQFPDTLDMQLNIEIGLALVRNRDPVGRLFMRKALWSAPWNRSVLAAALVVDQQGLHGLVEELNTPPSRVSDNDLRRIGFALGELGGVDQVEALARRRSSGDPVLQGAYLGALGVRTQ